MKRKILDYFLGKKTKALPGGIGKKERRKYKAGKGKKFPRKTNPAHERILEGKKYWLQSLHRNLKAETLCRIRPVVKNALKELNRLPFLYTFDSGGGWATTAGRGFDEPEIETAGEHEKIYFKPAYIEMGFDLSNQKSFQFARALSKWQKNKFPKAKIIHWISSPKISVIAPGINRTKFEITGSELNHWQEQSKNFMDALAEFAKSFPKK